MKKMILLAAAVVLTMLAASCDRVDSELDDAPARPADGEAELTVRVSNLDFTDEAEEIKIAVASNREWTCDASAGWIHGRKEESMLVLTVDANDGASTREGSITLTAAQEVAHTIGIRQLGWGKDILLGESETSVEAEGGVVGVRVTTNLDLKVESDAEWCYETDAARTRAQHPMQMHEVRLVVTGNDGEGNRTATVTFSGNGDDQSDFTPKTFTVTQSGMGKFDRVPGNESEYALIEVASAEAVCMNEEFYGEAIRFKSGFELEKSFDGDLSTRCESTNVNGFPVEITYRFAEKETLEYIVYHPYDTAIRGQFQQVSIYVLTDATRSGEEEWTYVTDSNLGGRTSESYIYMPDPIIGVTAVRIEVHQATGWMVSCAEMEFYKRDAEGFDYTTLFTDRSCSELREGVTEEDIAMCGNSFYRSMAYYMYHDRYPREFRINTFKCYPYPTLQASLYKTNAYSLLDNPTGISVEEGEEITVMAELHGRQVSLLVQNLYKPDGDGFGGPQYQLGPGINRLKMSSRGLVYVMYHHYGEPENYREYLDYPPIRLHFVSGGRVNGYYDSQDPALRDRGGELLDAAVDDFFDILGEYSHIIFPTADLRRYTGSRIGELVYYYDRTVYNEQEFMGLKYYDKMFANRMAFCAMYHSFAYAAQFHTSYNAAWGGHMAQLCDVKTVSGSMWETAHEVGHINQTRPGLKWIGMTECTNNLMSLYIQTAVANEKSRLQVQNASYTAYMQQWNEIMLKGRPHCDGGIWAGLVPFWQLQLYFGELLGNTPMKREDRGGFYPDVYEYIRNTPNLSHGESQANFAYVASLCAGMDLTDFFEKHGFLTVVDKLIGDYGSAQLTVTQEYADDVRQRIAELKLPKPEIPLEYLTDNNKEILRYTLPVVKGNPAWWSYDMLMVEGWQNVMVYEVTDGSGNVVYVADASYPSQGRCEFKVTLPEGISQKECRLYAVQYDSKRLEVEIVKP